MPDADLHRDNAKSSTRSWRPHAAATSTRCSPCSIPTSCCAPIARPSSVGADEEVIGSTAVAETFAGRARVAQPALVDGDVGLAWLQGGTPRVVFDLTIADGRIVEIELLADAARLEALDTRDPLPTERASARRHAWVDTTR